MARGGPAGPARGRSPVDFLGAARLVATNVVEEESM